MDMKYQDILNLNLAAQVVNGWLWSTEHKIKRRTDDLEIFCMEERSEIPFSVFYNLIRCYGRRLHAVLLAKGGGCRKY